MFLCPEKVGLKVLTALLTKLRKAIAFKKPRLNLLNLSFIYHHFRLAPYLFIIFLH